MKGLKAKVTKGIQVGTHVKIADNSGAKTVMVLSAKGYRGVKSRIARIGVGDVFTGVVKTGNPDVRHTLVPCVIIRQRRAYRRKNGVRIRFEDNAAIVMKDIDKGEPKGTLVKGPVAKEVIERYSLVTRISTLVV